MSVKAYRSGFLTAAPSAAKHVNVIEPCGDVRNNVAVWVAEVDGGRLSRREGKVCLSLPPSVRPEKADAAGPA